MHDSDAGTAGRPERGASADTASSTAHHGVNSHGESSLPPGEKPSLDATTPGVNLADPVWTLYHVAAAFAVSIDTARELSYLDTFPHPRARFRRNLWTREEVLAWFSALPTRTDRRTRLESAPRPTPGKTDPVAGDDVETPTPSEGPANRRRRPYTPRRVR